MSLLGLFEPEKKCGMSLVYIATTVLIMQMKGWILIINN
jgi:hypothetical protein